MEQRYAVTTTTSIEDVAAVSSFNDMPAEPSPSAAAQRRRWDGAFEVGESALRGNTYRGTTLMPTWTPLESMGGRRTVTAVASASSSFNDVSTKPLVRMVVRWPMVGWYVKASCNGASAKRTTRSAARQEPNPSGGLRSKAAALQEPN
uniref:Uncharacterized protein n=1 Tax=Oryza sativa subsp. japonica TaxID=39947 RepID=Q5Z7I9_ORYSJ|nr:hypothetical protein [Oryza sativa Japonica Group]